jgi:hypothetical protein
MQTILKEKMLKLSRETRLKSGSAFVMTTGYVMCGLMAASCATSSGVPSGAASKTTASETSADAQPGSASSPAAAEVSSSPRILTLGDSLTAIFRYQKTLRELLKKDGHNAVFVGSQGQGDDKHEGHSGWQIGQIEDNIVKWMDASTPDVVLLQIGTNNMNHGLGLKGKTYPPYQEDAPAQAAQPGKILDAVGATWGDSTYGTKYLKERIDGLLDKILAHSSKPVLVVAQIPPIGRGNPKYQKENDECVARIKEYNAMLENAVEARRKAGKPIALVDNFSGHLRDYGTTPEHTYGDEKSQNGDWVHPRPDALAWSQMGERFYAGFKILLKM